MVRARVRTRAQVRSGLQSGFKVRVLVTVKVRVMVSVGHTNQHEQFARHSASMVFLCSIVLVVVMPCKTTLRVSCPTSV